MTDIPNGERRSCSVCGRLRSRRELIDAPHVRQSLSDLIRADVSDWSDDSCVCTECLQRYRQLYLTRLLADESGELGELEAEVAQALTLNELLTLQNAPEDLDEDLSFGEKRWPTGLRAGADPGASSSFSSWCCWRGWR